MIRASVDIGSNSVLLLAVEINADGNIVQNLANESNVTGLGKGLDIDGKFNQESMDLTFDVLKSYMDICHKLGLQASEVVATATEAARKASNAKLFFQSIKQKLGIDISIITGEAEAYFSTAGILLGGPFDSSIISIMDIGGASTEIIEVEVKSKNILKSFSMPVGAVRLTSWLEKKTNEKELTKIFDDYINDLNSMRSKKIYCVAGTMTSVANILLGHKNFIESEVHGYKVDLKTLEILQQKLSTMHTNDLNFAYPFLGKRSQTIKAGLDLAIKILTRIGADNIEISTYGLRYGTILSGKIPNDFIFNKEK